MHHGSNPTPHPPPVQMLAGEGGEWEVNPCLPLALSAVIAVDMPYDDASDDDGEDDEGMDDPVILRGLLQCISIAVFFTVRYVFDVLLTVPVVQTLSHRLMILAHWGWCAARCFPVASLALLYIFSSLETGLLGLLGFFARLVLRGCILRALLTTLFDDSVVLWPLKKRYIWVPLGWLVTFTRVSSGRMVPQGIWRSAHYCFVCRATPWLLRLGLFWATWSTPYAQESYYDTTHHRHVYEPRHVSPDADSHPPEPPTTCASYTGFPIPCDELGRVRDFNSRVMPTMRDANYRAIRKAMNGHGFAAHVWHVGHAIPDPSKSSTRNEEDFGWNLFAQHAVDNLKLGACLVSCAEARHVGADHVQCSTTSNCMKSPSQSA